MFAIVPKIFSPRTARIRSRYCSGAASEAVADSTVVHLVASASVGLFTNGETVISSDQ